MKRLVNYVVQIGPWSLTLPGKLKFRFFFNLQMSFWVVVWANDITKKGIFKYGPTGEIRPTTFLL